ncbi:nidogen isoform X2 [Folsomia candida]|uniref:nidogen isoform X2 n=1 Tax=Folsomia candida TaxID=158441 RepID=UPI000B90227F|nr:nidogen isoform X2 [Folsomia candida]
MWERKRITFKIFFLSSFVFLSNFYGALSEDGVPPKMFPYGLDHVDVNLPRDVDDISSPEIRLQTPIVLYGQQYTSVFVNQNGLISFLTEIPTFVNIQFPLDYPVIAPFYSDVDTRISGTVYYRETQADELLERARTMFSDHFSSAVNFQPSSLLIVTWDDVGYFDRKSDKSNTYQLVIGSDGGDSYVVFLYDKIQWIQGTGKNPSLPDAKAQAGLNSGNGPHFELKGSGTDQVSNIHKRSNVNEEGVWMLRIGRVSNNLDEPDLNVPRESSPESSSSCASGGVTSCHSQASCVDYNPGFCCQCRRHGNFFGNGRVCLQEESPLRVNGKVRGVFNGVAIDDSDLFSYIVPQDGRAYTAIAKIPERLGYDMQTVITLGTSIGWLFSTAVKGAPNGFSLTGGVMNYTSEINFHQTGHKVQLHQNFMGLDVFSHLKVDSRIHGSVPIVPVGKTIEVNDLKMEFTRVSAGLLRSRSSHSYVVEGTSQEHPFTIEQTIEYEECPFVSPVPPEMDTLTTKVGRHYIVYDVSQEIVRYAITSKVSPVDGEDPCKVNKDKCGPNSSCVVEGDNYRCICNLGYEQSYTYEDDGAAPVDQSEPECTDVDECQIGTSTCDVTAVCYNSPGSYSCECLSGYSGDGYTCTKILSCADVQCGQNAECVELSAGNPECRCLPKFYGDGLFCYEPTGVEVGTGDQPDCRQVRDLCDPFAECVFSSSSESYVCSCQQGYTGDGLSCHRDTPTDEESCDIINNCHPYADCKLDETQSEYTCVCQPGYFGDGYSCLRSQNYGPSYEEEQQRPNPVCVLGSCYCSGGYEYDEDRGECKFSSVVKSSSTEQSQCDTDSAMCDSNASCLYQSGKYKCVCLNGFSGNGLQCSPQDYCSSHSECSLHGECAYDPVELRYSCRCRNNFEMVGKECRPKQEVGCDILRNCDTNAQCSWDARQSKYACECKPGFRGNGLVCREEALGGGCQGPQCTREASTPEGDQIVVAKGMSLIKIQLQGNKAVPLTVDPFQTAIGIDFDCFNQKLYWSDVATRAIKMGNVNGSGKGSFLDEDIGSPEGLSIDWASGNIYWTDSLRDTIEVANLKNQVRKTVVSTDLVNPRGIAVYPQRGRLFWSDWNRDYPKIEYSGLDGQERQVLVGEGLALPNSLVVDTDGDQLCWADAGTHKIECVGIDGRNRRTQVMNVPYPFGLALGPDHFYWSDWESKQIESASRRNGERSSSYEVSLGGPGKLYGVVYIPAQCPQMYSPCEYSPCGNERICLPNIRGGRSCICGDNAPDECQNLL